MEDTAPSPPTSPPDTPRRPYVRFLTAPFRLLQRVADSKIVLLLCLATLPATLLLLYTTTAEDYDVWFHLAYGRHYVENLTFQIDHSMFSWTPADPDWLYGTWLGSAALYLTWLIGGVHGLYILQWLTLLGMFALFCVYVHVIGERFNMTHVVSFLLIFVTIRIIAIYIKPEMFSTFLFTLTAFMYFYARSTGRSKILLFFPLLFLLWVNTHGGFVIGLFLVCVLFGLEFLAHMLRLGAAQNRTFMRHFGLGLLLSWLAIMITPEGPAYAVQTIVGLIQPTEATKLAMERIAAHRAIWHSLVNIKIDGRWSFDIIAWSLVLMLALFLIAWLHGWWKNNQPDFVLLLLNGIFFLFAMSMARAVVFYPPVWFFSLHALCSQAGSLEAKSRWTVPSLFLYAILSAWLLLLAVFFYPHADRMGFFQDDLLPVAEVNYIMDNELPEPLLNDYLTGGYMMWTMFPKYKVFIDPRRTPYEDYDPINDWLTMDRWVRPGGVEEFTDKYGFKTALLHLNHHRFIFWLLSSPEWSLAFFDKNAAVLIRSKLADELLEQGRLKHDVSPSRFQDLRHPVQLLRLFKFYTLVGPDEARAIRQIYANNVTMFYIHRNKHLFLMDRYLEVMEKSGEVSDILDSL